MLHLLVDGGADSLDLLVIAAGDELLQGAEDGVDSISLH